MSNEGAVERDEEIQGPAEVMPIPQQQGDGDPHGQEPPAEEIQSEMD